MTRSSTTTSSSEQQLREKIAAILTQFLVPDQILEEGVRCIMEVIDEVE